MVPLTFDISDDDHDEVAVVVSVVGVVNASGDFTGADDFLQRHQHEFDGQEGHALVEEVERAVEQQVPGWESGHAEKNDPGVLQFYSLNFRTENTGVTWSHLNNTDFITKWIHLDM